MRAPGKNSAEVVQFMTLFTRLKDWSDDAPAELSELAATDSSVKDLCTELYLAAWFLKMNERRARALFSAPVDPAFITAWRDYEKRYESIVLDVWLSILFPNSAGAEPPNIPRADQQWTSANAEAKEQTSGIESAIYWARCEVESGALAQIDCEDFLQNLKEGVAAWDRLVKDHGLDLRGVFRRRALIPFVLVPRHVASKHGSGEALSMLKNLQQAHDAFVFGAPYAAVGLMRSIMEAMLRDHYRAEGRDLSERIRSAGSRLPPGANEAALHRLRKLANAILHLDREKDERLPDMDEVGLEKQIVSLLFVLRALIEGASGGAAPAGARA